MATALVTGASGFVGRHLVRALCECGWSVRCLVRRTSKVAPLEELGVELVRGTLQSMEPLLEAVRGVQYVFHLAALTTAYRYGELLEVNGRGTARVAQACRRQKDPPVLVYCSSIAAAGPTRVGCVRRESDPAAPISHYGHSKRAGELAVQQIARSTPVTIVRPGIVFGEENQELLPVFQAIRRFRVHAVAGLHPPRLSLIEVKDLTRLMIEAALRGRRLPETDDGGGRGYYFACAPEYPTYVDLGRMVRGTLGRPHAWILFFPAPFPWLIAGAAQLVSAVTGRRDALTVDKIREALAPNWACSCEAARRELGFQPSGSLADQLQANCRWYLQKGWL